MKRPKELITRLGIRSAIDNTGQSVELEEFSDLVAVWSKSGWGGWEPRDGHGQLMKLSGKPLVRITDLVWETTDCPARRLYLTG